MTTSALLNVMSAAVIKAGKGLVRDFGEVDNLQISRKGTSNFVTSADVRTEKFLQRELGKARPDFGFLLEEGGEIIGKDSTHRWVIDPLDGTSNFIHAVPYFCISVGLEHITAPGKSEIVAAVIFDPIHNDLFMAEKGKGATLNGRKLNVSSRYTMDEAMLVTGNPKLTEAENRNGILKALAKQGGAMRCFGATALDLANLAAGRFDACWYYSFQPWDIAAGLLLIQEAGGIVAEINGKPASIASKTLVSCNRVIYPQIQKILSAPA